MTSSTHNSSPPSPQADGTVDVLLAGGSAADRRNVRLLLAPDARFTVVAEARTRAELLTLAAQLRPTAVVLDPDLPQGALAALAELMATQPLPVVVFSDGGLASAADAAQLRAAGAVDVLARSADGADLRASLLLASRIRVIRHPGGRLARPRTPETPAAPLIAIGASTGGPTALATLLAALPADLPAAVLLVQHMPAGFLSGLAGWLDGCCALPVRVGKDGQQLCAGEVIVCPGSVDSVVESAGDFSLARLRCRDPRPPAHHVPSVDRAFTSVAAVYGPAATGVILTGMGSDGTAGMAALRASGALTIAQDESTCAIYGMPRAAAAAGVVDRVLALPQIADALAEHIATSTRLVRGYAP